VAAPWARRTLRLAQRLVALALALGGRAGVRLSHAWALAVNRNTLWRAIRRHPVPALPTPTVLGVDDWSRTFTLRVISPPSKPGKMPLYHIMMRGHCYDSASRLLPAGYCRMPLVLHHATIPGQAEVWSPLSCQRNPYPPRLNATAQASPNRLQVSSSVRLALHVNMMPAIPSRLHQDGPTLCPLPTGALV
jgi:hypothetical protein